MPPIITPFRLQRHHVVIAPPRFSGEEQPEKLHPALKENDRFLQPPEMNMKLGKIYATGTRGVSPNPEKAVAYFDKAIEVADGPWKSHLLLEQAKLYMKGFHSLRKNPDKARQCLEQALECAKCDSDKRSAAYTVAQAKMLRVELFQNEMSRRNLKQEILDVEKAARNTKGSAFLAEVGKFFGRVLHRKDKANAFAALALRAALSPREDYQSQHREDDTTLSSGPLMSRELVALGKSVARGRDGFNKDPKLASEILNAVARTVKTPNPVMGREVAQAFAKDLNRPDRARQVLLNTLKAKYPLYLEAAEILARDIKDDTLATVVLRDLEVRHDKISDNYSQNDFEKWKLDFSDNVQFARIYAVHLNNPEKAKAFLKKADLKQVPRSFKTYAAIELAKVYALGMKDPAKAKKLLESAKKSVDHSGSGNPQAGRLKLADAFITLVQDTDGAVSMLQEATELAFRYINTAETLNTAAKILKKCDPQNPQVGALRREIQVSQKYDQREHDV